MSTPFKHLDISRNHLAGIEARYVVPPAHDEEIIKERKAQEHGMLTAQYQANGLQVAAEVVDELEDAQDITYAAQMFAPAGLVTMYHGSVEHSNRMRRETDLPNLSYGNPDGQLGLVIPDVLQVAQYGFHDSVTAAHGLVRAIENHSSYLEKRRVWLGRIVGRASLALACTQVTEAAAQATPFVAQSMARQQGLRALAQSRDLANELGVPPSLAQLADPDSPLAVHIRRNAPSSFRAIFMPALEKHQIQV